VPRILSPQEIVDDWHPLDHKPAPEYIPPYWIGTHAGKRLAEALRTLRCIPINGVPQGFATSWPEYAIEWGDSLAQLAGDEEQQKQEVAARNWSKTIPTSVEISRMEAAIIWPGRYLGGFPQLVRAVGAVASARARGQNIAAARKAITPTPPPGTRPWPRRGYRPRCQMGPRVQTETIPAFRVVPAADCPEVSNTPQFTGRASGKVHFPSKISARGR
jgi:hypothetical protein